MIRAVAASSIVALAGVVLCWVTWGWTASAGIALGWAAAAASVALNVRVLGGTSRERLRLRIMVLALLKWPVLVVMVYFAGRLGVGAAAAFVVGACSVYLALAAGAIRSLRSHE